MDRLQEMEVFVTVVDSGSFVKAANRLRVSPAAVSRAISALEGRLGAQVLVRTTRSFSLTDSGQRFLEGARPLLTALEVLEKEAVGEAAAPRGRLTVTASVALGRLLLPQLVAAFIRKHTMVDVSVLLLDRVVSLIDEGVDVALRVGDLPDSSLVARRVGIVRRVLVASPKYLARHGVPRTPSDLRKHVVVAFTGLMPNRQWRHIDGDSDAVVSLAPRLEFNDGLAALDAVEAGEGITQTLFCMVHEQLRDGRLAQVLDPFTLPPVPVHLLYPQSQIVAPKVRAFIEFAAPRLAETLELGGPYRAG